MSRNAQEEQAIKRFIEFAKSTVPSGATLEQDFENFLVSFNGYWARYRVKGYVPECPITEGRQMDTLPECARHCWKLLMFRKQSEDVEESVNLLTPLLKEGLIKSFKHNGDRSVETTLDYVIVIYTWGLEERDTLKAKLHSLGFTSIPYRRGCKSFEKKFGPWRAWFKDEHE